MAAVALKPERRIPVVPPCRGVPPLEAACQRETGGSDALDADRRGPLADAGQAPQLEPLVEDDAERLAGHELAIRRAAHPDVDLALQAEPQLGLVAGGRAQPVRCKPDADQSAE